MMKGRFKVCHGLCAKSYAARIVSGNTSAIAAAFREVLMDREGFAANARIEGIGGNPTKLHELRGYKLEDMMSDDCSEVNV